MSHTPKQKRIKNLVKHLRRRFLQKTAKHLQSLFLFSENSVLDVLRGSEYMSQNSS